MVVVGNAEIVHAAFDGLVVDHFGRAYWFLFVHGDAVFPSPSDGAVMGLLVDFALFGEAVLFIF